MALTDDTQPWTTTRCTRLLRPLSSKLSKLARDLELPHNTHIVRRTTSSAFATKGSPHKTTNFTRPAHKPRGFEKATDPDWRPGDKAVKPKRTYGGRGGVGAKKYATGHVAGRAEAAARPGEIAFTPLIARMGVMSSPAAVQASPLKKFSRAKAPLLAVVERAPAGVPVEVQRTVQGILEAYGNILQATGSSEKKEGTRSLFGACLRKLPAYIELEEYFARLDIEEEEEEPEGRDIAREVYEDLEAQFEQQSGGGWRPFKQVLRAHGTSLLCGAISGSVLGLEGFSCLITHCLHASAWDEAEQLLTAYVPLLEPLSMPINTYADLFDEKKQPYLAIVKTFVSRTGRHQFLYNLLDHMVALGLMPLEWLATSCMRPIWDRLVRTISEDDHRTIEPCTRFLETCSLAGMGLASERLEDEGRRRGVPSPKEDLRQALNTTYSSLITVLCSIALVHNGREDTVGKVAGQRVVRALDTITIALTSREDVEDELRSLEPDTEDLQVFAQRALWAVTASFLVHLGDSIETSLDLIASLNHVANHYSSNGANISTTLSSLPALIASTARGTGRIWNDDGFEQLQRTVDTLMTASGHQLPHKLWTLKRLALESALEFAKGTGAAQHVRYSQAVEKKLRTSGRLVIAPTPRKNATTSSPAPAGGFRWEEGIGEWVACTPFARHRERRRTRAALAPAPPIPLPTPTHSASDSESDPESAHISDTEPDCDSNLDADVDDDLPPSSPIKRIPTTNRSNNKKRRASSPVVLITARKRTHVHMHTTTPLPPTPDSSESEPRRLRKRVCVRVCVDETKTKSEVRTRVLPRRRVARGSVKGYAEEGESSGDELSFA